MKRLFFSVLALTLGAFAFWSCDKEEEIDNGKGKPAERGTFMTVQQQRDAFQDNLDGIAQTIDFSDFSQAAEVVAEAAGKKWGFMSLMPILNDSALIEDSVFFTKINYAIQFLTGDYDSFENMEMDLRPLYMAADVHVLDTVIYGDTIGALEIHNVRHDVDYLLLNVFINNHAISFKAKVEPGDSELDYFNADKHFSATLPMPEIVEITLTLDGKVLADIKSEYKSDYRISYSSDEEDGSFTIEGSKTSAKGNAKIGEYELDGKLDFDKSTGASGYFTAKFGNSELISVNCKMDANMDGVDMTDSAQVLAWAQNPEKLKSISVGASLRGGKVEFKINTLNPFKDEELARILRSQMMPGATMTKEEKIKMHERFNEIVDGGFYFEGFKEPQAKIKYVYKEILDEVEPVIDEDDASDSDVIDIISSVLFKSGAYTVLVVHDDEGYEKEIEFDEYFTGINYETITQTLTQKVLEAFGPLLVYFDLDDEEDEEEEEE